MLPTTKFLIRQGKQLEDGSYSLYLRVTQNRITSFVSLKINIFPEHFDFVNTKCLRKHPNAEFLNKQIEFYKQRVQNIVSECVYTNQDISLLEFKNRLLNNQAKAESFSDYILQKLQELKGIHSKETYHTYYTQVTKILQFRKPILFIDISPTFFTKYKEYMIKRGNKQTTIGKSLSMLRTFTNWAREDGYIKNNPLEGIKIQKGQGNRKFLSYEELEVLEKLYAENKLTSGKQNLLKVFLFSCFTGLRFTDMKRLRYNAIDGDFIEIIQHKTNIPNRIFLIDRAKELIKKEFVIPTQFVFRFPCNQKSNEYLKEIMTIAGIEKQISFHCARHTFATVSLNLGIPIEVVSKGLGHTNITTTQIYAKLLDKTKVEQFSKWNRT